MELGVVLNLAKRQNVKGIAGGTLSKNRSMKQPGSAELVKRR